MKSVEEKPAEVKTEIKTAAVPVAYAYAHQPYTTYAASMYYANPAMYYANPAMYYANPAMYYAKTAVAAPAMYYANSGGAVHVVKREAEAAPEAEAEAYYGPYGYGYSGYGYSAYRPYAYSGYYGRPYGYGYGYFG